MTENQIEQSEARVNPIIDGLHSTIITIPGISYRMAAIIIVETENFSNHDSAEKVLVYAGLEPSVYQSGQLISTHTKWLNEALNTFGMHC